MTINVKIKNIVAGAPGQPPKADFDPEPVPVHAKNVGNKKVNQRTIKWTIETAGWQFDTSDPQQPAIAVTGGQGVFTGLVVVNDPPGEGTKPYATLVDENPSEQTFPYVVNLVHVPTQNRVRVDPTISNKNGKVAD